MSPFGVILILHNVRLKSVQDNLLADTSGHFAALGMLIAMLPVRGSKRLLESTRAWPST